ncbi:MAG: precorrin-6y C5,15-methyltransferase (decarboxylating) subunit CbiE [Candidatus Methylarchaceae archaeon HK02M1]|nr:precorrin-6y C5,15-methyltransferase (decarboxylating) subunit CbiE [Candidatus Methylarchaceae archaeon HK02M1]
MDLTKEHRRAKEHSSKIFIVGAGPGTPDFITPIARKTVNNAHLLIGSKRVLDLFTREIRGEVLPLTASNINNALKRAIEVAKKGKLVVMLSTGDPCIFGLLKPVLKIKEDVKVEVIPGISSIQTCIARLCLCWDDIDFLISFHEGTSPEKEKKLIEAIKEGKNVILLPDSKSSSPSKILDFLLKRGFDEDLPLAVCERLTYPEEKIVKGTLGSLSRLSFDPLCVMVIGKVILKQNSESGLKVNEYVGI